MPALDPTTPCPCGSGLPYGQCCGPCHRGEMTAPTPEALMRSRYCAFALGGLGQYLLDTWAEDAPGRPPEDAPMLSKRTHDWCGLEIMAASEHGAQGSVEFRAHFKAFDGTPGVLHERSVFRKSTGRWRYVDGILDPPRRAMAGRNDPCPCNSGKKSKKCCGA